MKALRKVAALAALLVAGSFVWAQDSAAYSPEEFKKLQDEYTSIRDSKSLDYVASIAGMLKFSRENPNFISAHVDLAIFNFRTDITKDAAIMEYGRAMSVLGKTPDSPEGKLAKAKFYQLSAELVLAIVKDEAAAEREANKCIEYDDGVGTELSYELAKHYMATDNNSRAFAWYQKALKLDKDLERMKTKDVQDIASAYNKIGKRKELNALFERILNQKKGVYYPTFGAAAASSYEKCKQKPKAVFVAMLDQEYTDTYKESSPEEMLSILEKSFKKDKDCAPCIDFVRKFYDKDAALEQADLDSLQEDVRGFLTVRYMYKMKNSNDIAALREEFESFFKPIGNFYIRLYEKAEKNGDKAAQKELAEILLSPACNSNGLNRFAAKMTAKTKNQ